MKRKREEGSPQTLAAEAPPLKKWAEAVTAVEIPSFATHQSSLSRPTGSSDEEVMRRKLQDKKADKTGKNRSINKPADAETHDKPQSHQGDGIGSHRPEDKSSQISKPVASSFAIQQTIESQFNLEILLKHKELRLIDQELGKCQVALEQLRRCRVIPYPATKPSSEAMQQSVDGFGAVYDNTAPQAPAWGVTDGPYSRHYQRWLLQDSVFDDSFVEPTTPLPGSKTIHERPTRGVKSDKTPLSSISRAQRGSNARLKALPQGYPEVKEEKGPMIVKRSSDGKMVKLVCLDCRRSNFNSAQGFINHCRIAHGRQFLSHDAAIEACGEDIDAEDEGAAEGCSGRTTASAGLVHPLIRSAHLLKPTTPDTTATLPKRKQQQQQPSEERPSLPKRAMMPSGRVSGALTQEPEAREAAPAEGTSSPFLPSNIAPHLSRMLSKMGKGGNLDALVNDATTKPAIDLDEISDDEGGLEEGQDDTEPKSRSTRGVVSSSDVPVTASTTANASRRPAPMPEEQARLQTKVESPQIAAPHPPSPLRLGSRQLDGPQESFMDFGTPLNLSPNTTDPHPAPSLVSDDGDHETAHTDSDNPCSGDEDESGPHYLNTEVMDHDDMEMADATPLTIGPTTGKHHHHHPSHHVAHSPIPERRSRLAATYPNEHDPHSPHGEQHVSFAKPVRTPKKGSHK